MRLFRYLIKILFPYSFYRKILYLYQRVYSFWVISSMPLASKKSRILPNAFILGERYIQIGEGTIIGEGNTITARDSFDGQQFNPKLSIGNNVNIGNNNHITCINRITISDGVLTGKNVTITDNSHGQSLLSDLTNTPLSRPLYSKGPVVIGKNVWIGDKATVLPGVTIGEGAIIASNAVVTKDIPPYTVAAGCPAKIVKICN